MVAQASTQRPRREDHHVFEASLGYTVTLKPAWTGQHSETLSQNIKREREKKRIKKM